MFALRWAGAPGGRCWWRVWGFRPSAWRARWSRILISRPEHPTDDRYLVRDSKNPDGATLVFSSGGWTAFLGRIKAGEFDTRP
ncbi:DUF397 domain-containing protein [Streptosporangium sp. NPDC002607]